MICAEEIQQCRFTRGLRPNDRNHVVIQAPFSDSDAIYDLLERRDQLAILCDDLLHGNDRSSPLKSFVFY